MSDIIYITQEWLEKLENELKFLKENKRIEIAEKLKEAISFWDLSENSEYEDARNEQAYVEKKILDIEEQLKNIQLIDETQENIWDKVKIGSIVEIKDLDSDEINKYKIVWTTEVDILNTDLPKISNESPVWKAILWLKKDSEFIVKNNLWVFKYKLMDIK